MAVLSDKSSQLPAMEVFVTNDGNLEILRSYGTKVHKLSIDMAGGEMRYDAESVTEDLETTVLQHDDGIRRCYGCIFGIIGVLKVPPSDWLYLIGNNSLAKYGCTRKENHLMAHNFDYGFLN